MTEATFGQVICTDRSIYSSVSAAKSAGKNAVAKIVYTGSNTDMGAYKNGLALALRDESPTIWSWASGTCTAKNNDTSYAVSGAYWMHANEGQWYTMIEAAGGYEALRDGFSGVGGINMQPSYYWWSNAYDKKNGKGYLFNHGRWAYCTKDANVLVRACLAF